MQEQKIIAVGVIRNNKGEVLAQKRINSSIPDADGKWEFPGGVVEFGETPEQAAVRECLEETGCTAKIIRFIPFDHSRVWERTDGTKLQAFVWFYELQYISGAAGSSSDSKVGEVTWHTKEEALKLDSLPGFKEVLQYIE